MEALGSGGLFMSRDMFEQIIGQLRADGAGYGGMPVLAGAVPNSAGAVLNSVGAMPATACAANMPNGLAGISDVPVTATNESKDFMSAFDDMDIDAL